MPRKRVAPTESIPDHISIEKFMFRGSVRPMITGYFRNYRNLGKDSDIIGLTEKIKEETSRDDGMMSLYYATRMVYTEHLEFDWHPEAPKAYTCVEDFWNMKEQGASDGELYIYYVDTVHNVVSNEWNQSLEAAQKIWRPPVENWDAPIEGEEVPEGEEPDPNS